MSFCLYFQITQIDLKGFFEMLCGEVWILVWNATIMYMFFALHHFFFCYVSFLGSSSEAWRLSPPNPYCFCWVCDGNSLG